jgi:hypothetical protein
MRAFRAGSRTLTISARARRFFGAAVRACATAGLLLLPAAALAQGAAPEQRAIADWLQEAPAHWEESNRKVEKLPRTTAHALLGGKPVATSFRSLQQVLKPGHQVVLVQPDTSRLALALFGSSPFWNRATEVAEVSAERLVLIRTRAGREQIVLHEDDVRRIEIIDTTRNGGLIGLAVGAAIGVAEIVGVHRDIRSGNCTLCPLGYAVGVSAPFAGLGFGRLIDGAVNDPIYERPLRRHRFTFGPSLGREAVAASATIGF